MTKKVLPESETRHQLLRGIPECDEAEFGLVLLSECSDDNSSNRGVSGLVGLSLSS